MGFIIWLIRRSMERKHIRTHYKPGEIIYFEGALHRDLQGQRIYYIVQQDGSLKESHRSKY